MDSKKLKGITNLMIFILFSINLLSQGKDTDIFKEREFCFPFSNGNTILKNISFNLHTNNIKNNKYWLFGTSIGFQTIQEECILSYSTNISLFSQASFKQYEIDFPRFDINFYLLKNIKKSNINQLQIYIGCFLKHHINLDQRKYYVGKDLYLPLGVNIPLNIFSSNSIKIEYGYNISNTKLLKQNVITFKLHWLIE